MMEILLLFLFLILFYAVPELLRRRKNPAEYQYPDIPEKEPSVATLPNQAGRAQQPVRSMEADAGNSVGIIASDVPTTSFAQDSTAWQGKLEPSTVVNGIIFAEILQAPRAYRPMMPRFSKFNNRGK